MTTVNDILTFMESFAPAYMQEDWDNTGLLCGSRSQEVRKIMVALDPFENVCAEAVEAGVDLLITHHPLIFKPTKSITDDTSIGRAIITLIRNNISAINAHTNLDCAPGGVNDILAQKLGLENIQVINPKGTSGEGRQWGLLRSGIVVSQPLEQFLAQVKSALGCKGLKYADGGKPVSKVAVGGGACGGGLMEAYFAGCDTFVTSDLRYNQFWDARDLGMNLIDAGHFHTENPVCTVIADQLKQAFPKIQVLISQNHTDCANFFL